MFHTRILYIPANHTQHAQIRIYLTEFWKTDQDVTFDIIYIYIHLRPSRLYSWFNKWLKQSQMTLITIKTLEILWEHVLVKITNA